MQQNIVNSEITTFKKIIINFELVVRNFLRKMAGSSNFKLKVKFILFKKNFKNIFIYFKL